MPVAEARSSVPAYVMPEKKLLPLLLARKVPLPVVLMAPVSVTPFWITVLLAPERIWLPLLPCTLALSSNVPPFSAESVPLLVTRPPTARVMVPPFMSALMVPLLVRVDAPPTNDCPPMKPVLPRTVIPLPSVRLPASTFSRLPPFASAKTMLPVPLMVWSPCGAKTLLLPMLTVPLSARPPVTRSMPVAEARSSVPLKLTPLKMLPPLLLARNAPVPTLVIVPLSVTPLWTTVLPAPATIWLPTPPLMLLLISRVPPFWADKVPLLVTAPPAASVMVPPETSALMVPLLVSVAAPPMNDWPPMKPVLPRTVTPLPSVRLPASRFSRLPPFASAKTMLPVPLMVWSPCGARMLLLPILTVPLSTSPPVTRSMPVPPDMSSKPFRVTPFRKLLPLLNAISAPVPVLLIVPPVIVLPNWLATLPLPMLMTPPALLMSWPPKICSAAVLGPPTLIVPVLVVLPLPCRVNVNASRLRLPALVRPKIDCPVSTVTVLPIPMVALSPPGPVGTMPHDQLPALPQLPVAGFQVQLAASACCSVAVPATIIAATASAVFLKLRRWLFLCWLVMWWLPGVQWWFGCLGARIAAYR